MKFFFTENEEVMTFFYKGIASNLWSPDLTNPKTDTIFFDVTMFLGGSPYKMIQNATYSVGK